MDHRFQLSPLTALLLPACLVGGLMLAGRPAAAQVPRGASLGSPVVPLPDAKNTRQALPPALPGARSNPATASEPDRPPSELAPTHALFDAINRRDISSVRDAIARGADL